MSTQFALKKATPVLYAEELEPSVAFWQRLGFELTVSVPHGEKLGFAILVRDGVELMYQSRASVAEDVPALAAEPSRVALYVEVDDLDEARLRAQGAPVVFPLRKTFYGAEEFGVREPAGNVVTFARLPSE